MLEDKEFDTEKELALAFEIIKDLMWQHCQVEDEDKLFKKHKFDSMALSANADALNFLARHRKVVFLKECGRRIIAEDFS